MRVIWSVAFLYFSVQFSFSFGSIWFSSNQSLIALEQVMWHPDVIHGVEDEVGAQQHPANVVYTAAVPMCPLNARCVSLLHRATPHASLVFIIPVTNDDLHSFFSRVLIPFLIQVSCSTTRRVSRWHQTSRLLRGCCG